METGKAIFGFPRNVFVLGLVSLFMDVSSEMIYPLIPLYLSNILHASKTSIGLIEGIAESTASVLKVFSGWLSDKLGKRKALIFWGYGISVFSRPVLATATSWVQVLAYRFTDRTGKGVRTAPRDAIIADSTNEKIIGKAFGFHRAMDTIGAIIGPGIAFLLMGIFHDRLQSIFWISIVPGLFAVLTIALFVKDVKGDRRTEKPRIRLKGLDRKFSIFLVVVAIFTIGKTSDAFLVLRAQDLGVRAGLIPVLYLVFNIVAASFSTHAGIVADKVGKRRLILASYALFALIFIGFAFATSALHAWLLFGVYGLFVAVNEGVQRAYVATIIASEIKATGYGIYHTVIGLATLPSSIIGGALWQYVGPQALFLYGAAMSVLSCILFAPMIFSRK